LLSRQESLPLEGVSVRLRRREVMAMYNCLCVCEVALLNEVSRWMQRFCYVLGLYSMRDAMRWAPKSSGEGAFVGSER
jgi:hypothetical protein